MSAQPDHGLSSVDAARRRTTEGPNDLGLSQRRPLRAIVIEVGTEPMFLLLIAAGLIYLLMGDGGEALVLLGFVLAIMGITIAQERRTDNALNALRDLSSPRALVIRDGMPQRIAGTDVVRDDLLMLAEGDRIAADGVLIETHELTVDESMLTGESVPVTKTIGDTVYAGTLAVSGQGLAHVTSIGRKTEMGRIGAALDELNLETSPLRRQMERLTRRFAMIGLLLSLALALAFWWMRGEPAQAMLAGIALAMSVLPQEFPVIMIVFFAFAARRLGRLQVLTRRLGAIETLGQTSVLCVDKTGTLTQNRMQLVALCTTEGELGFEPGTALPEEAKALLQAAALACEIAPHDPMEKAIRERAAAAGADCPPNGLSLVREYELSPALLAMSHVWRNVHGGADRVAAKGAPEAIASLCRLTPDAHARISQQVAALAARGLRVLGVAQASHDTSIDWPASQQGFDFRWLGLLALADPLRDEVPAAVALCREAGIRVVMITGDHASTAIAIAGQAGIDAAAVLTGDQLEAMDEADRARACANVNVFARVKPQQKLALVEALKAQPAVVAMTGDGVNDAPALKAAHIGIAMGKRGTDVAREAASLVLLKDDFASIVEAIRMGRRTYRNMLQAMVYTLAVHVPIVGLALLPVLFGLPLLLAPLHIAFLELVIDPACSIAFEAETSDEGLMQMPPRPIAEPLLQHAHVMQSLGCGMLTTAAAFGAYASLLSAGWPAAQASAAAFILLVMGNALLILPLRSTRAVLRSLAAPLPAATGWILAGTLAGLALATSVPPLAHTFRFEVLPASAWLLFVLIAVLMLPAYQGVLALARRAWPVR